MNTLRATFDQTVIDAWAAQVSRRKKGIGRIQTWLFLALALDVVLLLAWPNTTTVIALFVVVGALIVAQVIDRMTLLCPHCGQRPIAALDRGTSEAADYCVHCHYWLRSPYASHDATDL